MKTRTLPAGLTLLCSALLCSSPALAEGAQPLDQGPLHWRADHHLHLASADICERVGVHLR